jgi:hypothetical protein
MGVLSRIVRFVNRDGSSGHLVVENTGSVTETGGGKAVTGYSGPPPRRGQKIVVKNTGDATATGDGDAVSGISYT